MYSIGPAAAVPTAVKQLEIDVGKKKTISNKSQLCF